MRKGFGPAGKIGCRFGVYRVYGYALGLGGQGLGLRVWGLGFGVTVSGCFGFGVQGLRLRV